MVSLLVWICQLFSPRRRDRSDERRSVAVGGIENSKKFCDNTIKSCKYNLLTFLPLNLYEQFHRPINLYFLVAAALQFVPSVAPVSPYTTIFPISVAFSTNAIKEGIDDIRRYYQDAENNLRRYTVVNAETHELTEVCSKNIHVGDVLLLRPFEIVPCDVVVLMTSGEDGEAYISTESLDGETGTKERFAIFRDICQPELLSPLRGSPVSRGAGERVAPTEREVLSDAVQYIYQSQLVVESEGPNPFLHSYEGTASMTLPAGSAADGAALSLSTGAEEDGYKVKRTRSGESKLRVTRSVGARSASLQSRRKRNSAFIAETHSLLSTPAVDRSDVFNVFPEARRAVPVGIENVILASSKMQNTLFVLALAIFTGAETKVSMTRQFPSTKWATIDKLYNKMTIAIFVLQFLLVVVYSVLSDLRLSGNRAWYLGGPHIHVPPTEYFPVIPLRFFTMLSPMVPLSFKVMVELSKAYVSNVIRWDEDLKDENQVYASVNNSALAEDLGQVEYILSDKTGTLTCNCMRFHSLATADGKICRKSSPHELLHVRRQALRDERLRALLLGMTFCNTIERKLVGAGDAGVAEAPTGSLPTSSSNLRENMWMSCSPDEIALVDGAAECGMTLTEHTKRHGVASFGTTSIETRVVRIIPFSSARGRMSVLLEDMHNGSYRLLTKGSDEKVLPLCVSRASMDVRRSSSSMQTPSGTVTPRDAATSASSTPVPERTGRGGVALFADAFQSAHQDVQEVEAVLEKFSCQGLRTLVYAYRDVPPTEVAEWLAMVNRAETATVSVAERQRSVAQVFAAMERNLIYCGCTAVEDQLQARVGETISSLRHANIRLWMLTGDRSETARQTAVASGLLNATDHEISLAPPGADQMSSAEKLRYVREQLLHILTRPGVTGAERRRRHWWWSLYERSGLRGVVSEFFRPCSAEVLKPVSHPLRFRRDAVDADLYPPDVDPSGTADADYSDIQRLTTVAGPTQADERCGKYSITLSGGIIELLHASGDAVLLAQFKTALLYASTVICSRSTPDHKAMIVQAVKDAGKVVLAIGDGGNDVAMIQTSQVGVGIKGREGCQAALAADFSIGQFSFLSRLLLVHGHTAFHRTAMIVQQSFWKTVLIAWVQLLYNTYCDYSGVSFWDSLSLGLYNAIPTVPVTFLCVMDMPVSPWILMNNPQLYRISQCGRFLSAITFYGYIARAFLQGTVVFLLTIALQKGSAGILREGWTMDRGGDFYAAYFAVVTVHTYTVLTESHSITIAHWHCFLFSVYSCFGCFGLYGWLSRSNQTFLALLVNPSFYLSYVILTAAVCVSLAMYATVKFFWFPDLLQFQRLTMLTIREKCNPFSVLRRLSADDNPSVFWRSLSPFHVFSSFGPSPTSFSFLEGSCSTIDAEDQGKTSTSTTHIE